MRMLVVSDTSMYQVADKSGLEVFEPTLREIESISPLFAKVTWLGYTKGDARPDNARKPRYDNISVVALPTVQGGKSILAKLKIIPILPVLSWMILSEIRKHDVVHSRGPSVPAFLCILMSWFFRKKVFWHKYAGNWMEPSPPLMYKVQKRLLIRARHSFVTINGTWPDQPEHIYSLENPCLTREEWHEATCIGKSKEFSGKLVVCFVGLVAESKGAPQLIKALLGIPELPHYVSKVIIAGAGPALQDTQRLAGNLNVDVDFRGYLKRSDLNNVYMVSHVLILPSRTEGFPKVVAEASAFGCIPVVTDVSSISQYVEEGKNGVLLADNMPDTIRGTLVRLFKSPNLKTISEQAVTISSKFTYEGFIYRVNEFLPLGST